MATRVGIELSPVACRIVETEPAGWGAVRPETRVRSFATLPPLGPDMAAGLAAFRGRRAAVVVWDAIADHRLMTVADARHGAMRAEAKNQFTALTGDARIDWGRVLADIAPAGLPVDGAGLPVTLAVADAVAIRAVLQPLVAAGVRIRSVVTPALALWSLARARRVHATPDAIEAYVAVDQTTSCAALIQNGALIAARDIGWGYLEEWKGRPAARPRLDVAARLADELTALFARAGAPVTQVSICGGLSDLRSTTVPLMERLDLEVETLDSLFAIDQTRLPEPADDFRDRASELRLAWAVAADWRPPINLFREDQQRAARAALSRAAVIAGIAAGLGGAWQIERAASWRRTPPAPTTSRRGTQPPRGPHVPLARLAPLPPISQPMRPMPLLQPEVSLRTRPVAPRPAATARDAPRPQPTAPAPEEPAPFDARLGTILYAPDRTLAIVDGRIVQPGDEVKGARVVAITSTQVLLRDAGGRPRQLTTAATDAR
jgi:hypothetical protein